jgi:hypothetical protein
LYILLTNKQKQKQTMSISKGVAKRKIEASIKECPELVPDFYWFSEYLKDDWAKSWLLPFLHSETWHSRVGLEEGWALREIVYKIWNGEVWLCFIDMPDWDQPNLEMHENASILSSHKDIGVYLQNSPQGSDGDIKLKSNTIFKKVYVGDDVTPAKLPEIVVPAGTIFPIEIGTNSILKTWGYFHLSKTFAAFPYTVPLIKKSPKLSLFYIH